MNVKKLNQTACVEPEPGKEKDSPMKMYRRTRTGFTLIEVLIVVVIMAILAATIIPQFSTSTEDAKASQLEFNLHTLQSQIQLYQIQHNGAYPTIQTSDLPQLTSRTQANGTIDAAGPLGPYIAGGELPLNPLTNARTVAASTDGSTKTGGGWLYNATTGEIWADDAAP
jgi:prepilin-type N-terminal cleavage/methylation domain-containing protein